MAPISWYYSTFAATALSILLCGGLVYCVLTMVAARKYLVEPRPPQTVSTPISILKPLRGVDEGLADNLRTFFRQDYPNFEILFGVASADDPAIAIARAVMAEFPGIAAQLTITGESPIPNAKVFNLQHLLPQAKNTILLMADSDIRVSPEMLRVIAAEMHDPKVGLVTCPYRGVAGESVWSDLEAVGINTEFLSGILVARMLNGMDFAVGPTIAVKRDALDAIGGFDVVQHYLAEDFMMGKLIAESGRRVLLSSYVIEHRIGSQPLRANFEHRLRWARSTRRSRPWGYVGEIFTKPLPLALLLWALRPSTWPVLLIAVVIRAAAAWMVARMVLQVQLTAMFWPKLFLQDIASLLTWIGGFFGNTILWRGRRLTISSDGKFNSPAACVVRPPSPRE